ncbi:MAG: Histidine--tRNA ligase [Patescibacteria group bacterium]|jgi:histidyl-tRNA synthetase|nr:Histidine--tRNA ligase [Patescibacteria group bacterium]
MSEKKTNKEELLQTPKGMRDIIGEDYYNFQGFFEKAQEISEYYGFKPIQTPILEHEEIFTKGVGGGTDIVDKEIYSLKTKGGDKLAMRPEGTAPVMRAYIEHGMQNKPQPVKLYYYGPTFRHDKPQKGRYREFYQFGLEVLGSPKSIMDAMVIHMGILMLKEAGIEKVSLKINSIGDAESRKDYLKELVNYYKKHLSKMNATDRQRLKENPLRILDSKDPNLAQINAEAPQSVSYLNSASKKHFKEVMENLNELGVDYELDHTLVRGLDYYTHTVFEFFTETESSVDDIESKDGEEVVAVTKKLALGGGGRYDYLSKSMGHKKEVPGVGLGLGVDRIVEASKNIPRPRVNKKAKVYFIQLGTEAKMKSLKVIEILRQNKIPVRQSLSKDSLGSQLAIAEKSGIPVTLIFGQKEALENSIIVRDMSNRSQTTVDIDKLAKYLKNL